jgi:hypothetical protein
MERILVGDSIVVDYNDNGVQNQEFEVASKSVQRDY